MSKRVTVWLGLVAFIAGFGTLLFGASASAVTNSISRTYKTSDSSMTIGMAVSLSGTGASQTGVVRAKPENSKNFLGVVSRGSDNLVTLSSPSQEVVVTTSGTVSVLVSDINGTVKKGDLLVISPLEGVLMRGDSLIDSQQYLAVAVAQSDPQRTSQATVKDASGATKDVSIATTQAVLGAEAIGKTDYNGNAKRTTLVVFARSLTGKWVSEWQALGAFAVFITMLITIGVVVYGTVRSSILAMGRNPLSRKVITWQIVRVFGMAFALFVFGSAAAFLILWF